jgi:hypothetical protein
VPFFISRVDFLGKESCMAQRKYHRDSRGRFAGASGGGRVTMGRAGGFANVALRSRARSAKILRARKMARKKRAIKMMSFAGKVAVVGVTAVSVGRVLR